MPEILFCNKLIIILYMFWALCAHHQEIKLLLYSICYHHKYRRQSGAKVERGLCTGGLCTGLTMPDAE